jgi:hypothetical protein
MTSNAVPDLRRAAVRLSRLLRFGRARGFARVPYALARKFTSWRWWPKSCRFSVVEVFAVSAAGLQTAKRVPRVFTVRQAAPEDLPALQEFLAAPQLARDRLERGDVCLVSLVDDRIAAAVWLALGPNQYHEDWEELRCIFSFPAGVAWSYDGRGAKLGAWGSLMARLGQFAQELGADEIYCIIDYSNRPSIDSHLSLGCQRMGLVVSALLFGVPFRFYRAQQGPWRLASGRIGKLGVRLRGRRRSARPANPAAVPLPSAVYAGREQPLADPVQLDY